MNQRYGQFVLDSEIATSTGMNVELAIAVAKADIDRFSTYENDGDKYTIAELDYIKADDLFEKTKQLLIEVLVPVLERLHISLKPLPLLLSIPASLSRHDIRDWLSESEYSAYLSNITISKHQGNLFMAECLQSLDEPDAVLCIAVDSPLSEIEILIENRQVMSAKNPWGMIPSEGAAGMVLTKRNVIDTLKIAPQSQLMYMGFDKASEDRRGCSRLIRQACKSHSNLGVVYSDMTNQRAHVEDYGFAIGARSEALPNAQEINLTNEYWGTLGGASGIATIASMNYLHDNETLASLFLFDQFNTRSLLIFKPIK
ncbi:hypothetical protein [Aliivibrio sifiae]|uniref:Beta-ketoacyl synthase N-terminal domain-containing protein n=1 Tax=Aliivibrio sifiae TaxID=566293 RepID=A0A2S7X8B6_9GAMM|nr:hypothetical protein [Aliivibrio sifiae]PQJ87589.1 hypothetical protein BTO23_15930 [Aliivibrio sifiae]GLR73199.1 hypothetical protein GCM10007855_00720 [Aliivibrio sifiae]